MDETTRAHLFTLGNPYAKLSILSDEELERVDVATQSSRAKHRNRKSTTNDATQDYLFKLEDPYAKLSVVLQEELPLESSKPREAIDFFWKTRTDVYEYVSAAFALPLFRTRPPPLLKQFGEKVIRLSPRAQNAVHNSIAAYLPDEQVVYNRLSPKELDHLLIRLIAMADAANALDGQED